MDMAGAGHRRALKPVVEKPGGAVGTLIMQFVLMCVGFGLTLSAFGIWLVGGTYGAADMMLIKLGVSLFMLITGMCLIVIARGDAQN